MGIDRKSFLKIAATSGLGIFAGAATPFSNRWRERGVSLVSVERSSLVMGSIARFEVVAEHEKDGYEAIRRAVEVFRKLDDKLSMYNPSSEMGTLAKSAGKQPVLLSDDSVNVLNFAKKTWHQTGGKFDVTIEPAMKKWGFRKDPSTKVERPGDQELKKLEEIIGSNKLYIDGNQGYLEKQDMAVDLGGIAGGYALDHAIEEMKRADVAAAYINFSGDIHCFGKPLDGSGWPVHIYNPQTNQPLVDPVILEDEALSTSGAYQNRRDGIKQDSWGHLFLPGEARPVEPTSSFTAIHTSAMAADAWSTAGYVGAQTPDDVRWIII